MRSTRLWIERLGSRNAAGPIVAPKRASEVGDGLAVELPGAARRVVDEHVGEVGVDGLQVQLRDQLLEGRLRPVDPARTEIDRRAAAEVVGPHPTADPVSRLQHHHVDPGVGQTAGAGQARGAGADDGHRRAMIRRIGRAAAGAGADREEHHEHALC